jgi:hypothetical protein
MASEERYLRRYTDLPALIYLLKTKSITLLSPTKWDDSNDSCYLELYRKGKQLKSVLALCFTEAPERYHLWNVFGHSGVRIRFQRKALLKAIERRGAVRSERVEYVTLDSIADPAPSIDRLPFLKRYGFQDEREFRIIFESTKQEKKTIDIPIQLSCIDKIVLNPWLAPSLFLQTKEVLQSIDGCRDLNIVHSRLIDNEKAARRVIREAKRRSR